MKQVPNIMDVEFLNDDYRNIDMSNAVIYCDIPYQGTTKYETGVFDYDAFWNWCRKMSDKNIVIVSEYNAPADFHCIWEKESLANFDCNRGDDTKSKVRIEKLFTYNI